MEELMHYGVKGMKWRHKRRRGNSLDWIEGAVTKTGNKVRKARKRNGISKFTSDAIKKTEQTISDAKKGKIKSTRKTKWERITDNAAKVKSLAEKDAQEKKDVAKTKWDLVKNKERAKKVSAGKNTQQQKDAAKAQWDLVKNKERAKKVAAERDQKEKFSNSSWSKLVKQERKKYERNVLSKRKR